MKSIGARRWAIAEGYLPAWSHGPDPEMVSHGAFCLLNTGEKRAHVEVTILFSDREPAGPYQFEVEPQRTRHVRFNEFDNPESIPLNTEFASLIESDVPIVVQHTRLDSRQADNALMTTIAYSE